MESANRVANRVEVPVRRYLPRVEVPHVKTFDISCDSAGVHVYTVKLIPLISGTV